MNKKLDLTAEEYQLKIRQQAKARTVKFRAEQEKRGYKNLTIYLSEPFRAELKRLSDEKGLNRQAAMDHIFYVYQHTVNDNMTSNVTVDTPEPEPKTADPADLPNILDNIAPNTITVEDRDKLVLRLYEQFPGKKQAKDRIKVLNDAGILFNGEPWTVKRYSDQLTCARRRAKK